MTEPDPNWLLSTTAQSTAALVAIAGGFFLSRLLALAAERNGLALREAQLRDEVDMAGHICDSLQERVGNRDREAYRQNARNLLVEDTNATLEDALKFETTLEREELCELFEGARREVERAFAKLRPHASRGIDPIRAGTNPSLDAVLERLSISDDEEVQLLSQVWRRLLPSTEVPATQKPSRDAIYEEWVRDHERAEGDRTRIAGQLEFVRTELAKVSTPSGIGRLAGSLAFFLATGVVVPLAVLAQQPTRLSVWQAWLIFGCFAAGLVVVVIAVTITVGEAFPRGAKTSK